MIVPEGVENPLPWNGKWEINVDALLPIENRGKDGEYDEDELQAEQMFSEVVTRIVERHLEAIKAEIEVDAPMCIMTYGTK